MDFFLAKQAISEGTKAMAKISARKLILCELRLCILNAKIIIL